MTMRTRLLASIWALFGFWLGSSSAVAQDVGAAQSGNWSSGSTWTTGSLPAANANVFIGSAYPAGSAGTVTVTVSSAESAKNVYLGYNNAVGQVGTLDLTGAPIPSTSPRIHST